MLRCSDCHCYLPDYFTHWEKSPLLTSQLELHEALWGQETEKTYLQGRDDLRELVQYLLQPLADQSVVRVLELGSGRGWLSAAFKHWGCEVVAVEPSKILAEKASLIFSMETEFVNLSARDYLLQCKEEFDLIVMWHVLEHIDNPLEIISMARNRLSTDGAIAIQTPLPLKDYVFPEHLFFPAPQTYRFLADRLKLPIYSFDFDVRNAYLGCLFGGTGDLSPEVDTLDAAFLVNGYFEALNSTRALANERLVSIEEMGANIFSLDQQHVVDQREIEKFQINKRDIQRQISASNTALEAATALAREHLNTINTMRASIVELNDSLGHAQNLAKERYTTIEDMGSSITALTLSLQDAQNLAKERYSTIENMSASIAELMLSLEDAQKLARERYSTIENMGSSITALTLSLEDAQTIAKARYTTMEEMSNSIAKINLSLDHARFIADERLDTIADMSATISDLTQSRDHAHGLVEKSNEVLGQKKILVATMELTISDQKSTIERLNVEFAEMQLWSYPAKRLLKKLRNLFSDSTGNNGKSL